MDRDYLAGPLLREVRAASERLVASVEALDAEDLGMGSLLPGWNRAHVLTHIARNADGARNLLLAVRSGHPVRMYASPATREADIAVGAGRPPEVIISDAVEASWRFVIDAECLPAERWAGEIPFGSGSTEPASLISGLRPLEMRLREVEFHHVDLDVGYTFADSPAELAEQLLADTLVRLGRQGLAVQPPPAGTTDHWIVGCDGEQHSVRGAGPAALAWLTGRSDGAGLEPFGQLPTIPSLG